MENSKVSMRYAKAVYPIAKQEGLTEKLIQDLENIIKLITKSNDFSLFIKTPLISSTKKIKIFDVLFKGKIAEITYNFLKLLFEKNREVLIETICKSFIILYNQENNIITCDITSANELNVEAKTNVEKFVADITKMKVQANYNINKSLIGGIQVKIEDKIYDATIKTKLSELKNKLIE